MSRTTDARQAIQDLLESSDPSTVIQYDGISYRVATSGDRREGFYEILTHSELSYMRGRIQDYDETERSDIMATLAKGVAENAESWFRSARYNASLEAIASDQEHPTKP